MREEANIREVLALEPDYMGFIFYPKSARYVEPILQPEVLANFPTSTKKVGVFVNESVERILLRMDHYHLDMIQLHGDETPEYIETLKSKCDYPIVKAFGVHEDFDFTNVVPYQTLCDFLLFDTKSWQYGGTGHAFDWSVLDRYNQAVPFFLSGGLDPDNIQLVVQNKSWNLHAVDVNSKFEIEPALKDVGLLASTVFSCLNA